MSCPAVLMPSRTIPGLGVGSLDLYILGWVGHALAGG